MRWSVTRPGRQSRPPSMRRAGRSSYCCVLRRCDATAVSNRFWVYSQPCPYGFRIDSVKFARKSRRVEKAHKLSSVLQAVPFNLLNYALSLTAVPFSTYAWSSTVGILPGKSLGCASKKYPDDYKISAQRLNMQNIACLQAKLSIMFCGCVYRILLHS